MTPWNDVPIEETLDLGLKVLAKGGTFWIKFTCVACQSRQTSNKANTIHTGGYSCEACGHITHPDKFGMLVQLRLS